MVGAHLPNSTAESGNDCIASQPVNGQSGHTAAIGGADKWVAHGHKPNALEILNMDVTEQLGHRAFSDLFLGLEAEGSKSRKSALIHNLCIHVNWEKHV
jgi:hypothetical protein